MAGTPPMMAEFDSSATFVKATAAALHGRGMPMMGFSRFFEPVAIAAGRLPWRVRERISVLGGWWESVPPRRLPGSSVDPVYAWAASRYPRRRYPAVAIGSSNGAAAHLCAAVGAPSLPQTVLVPVRQAADPDDAVGAMEMAREPARALLDANLDVALHHMHDANQDRLMVRVMTYFRVKRRTLGPPYEEFLRRALQPGGTILLVECRRSWPTTRLGDRHVFQHGAVGGATEEEFLHGSERVRRHLELYGSERERWRSTVPDGRSPEAEWGFDEHLRDDVERFAAEHGYRVRRIAFEDTNALSPLVADLYRWWYGRRGLPTHRLLVESFFLVDPWWALRTASVPLWMTFNTDPDVAAAHRYLDAVEPYDEINALLFNHGTVGVGLPPVERWREVVERARHRGDLLGQRDERFPLDHASYARYHRRLRGLPYRYPVATRLTLHEVDDFLREHGDRFDVEWIGAPGGLGHRTAV